jgi:DNA repair protein RadA/Sms
MALVDVPESQTAFLRTGLAEFDHVMGPGVPLGSVMLLGGEPGIGKSTLVLQVVAALASQGKKVLYVSGEESEQHLRLRARRLALPQGGIYVSSQTAMPDIEAAVAALEPDIVVMDSVQVMTDPDLTSSAGSISQLTACTQRLSQYTKRQNITLMLIGHITKDGQLAGPKVIEHLVDIVLFFEGERSGTLRLLRSLKNRFFTTNEVGLFQMEEGGLVSVSNPSAPFLDATTLSFSGSVIVPVMEGSRALLIELQALVVPTGYATPRRTFSGVDPNRTQLLIAVLEKLGRYRLGQADVFVNVVGGYRLSEPAADLGILMAIVSSLTGRPLKKSTAVFGEVGLSGEVRGVPHAEKRLHAVAGLGMSSAIMPDRPVKARWESLSPLPVRSVEDAVRLGLGSVDA